MVCVPHGVLLRRVCCYAAVLVAQVLLPALSCRTARYVCAIAGFLFCSSDHHGAGAVSAIKIIGAGRSEAFRVDHNYRRTRQIRRKKPQVSRGAHCMVKSLCGAADELNCNCSVHGFCRCQQSAQAAVPVLPMPMRTALWRLLPVSHCARRRDAGAVRSAVRAAWRARADPRERRRRPRPSARLAEPRARRRPWPR